MSDFTVIDKTNQINLLYDFYGGLLTDKQRTFMEMHYLEDLSLSEIAEQTGVSRQAVHDHLRRSIAQLQAFEDKLHLVALHDSRLKQLEEIEHWLVGIPLSESVRTSLLARLVRLANDGEKEDLPCSKD